MPYISFFENKLGENIINQPLRVDFDLHFSIIFLTSFLINSGLLFKEWYYKQVLTKSRKNAKSNLNIQTFNCLIFFSYMVFRYNAGEISYCFPESIIANWQPSFSNNLTFKENYLTVFLGMLIQTAIHLLFSTLFAFVKQKGLICITDLNALFETFMFGITMKQNFFNSNFKNNWSLVENKISATQGALLFLGAIFLCFVQLSTYKFNGSYFKYKTPAKLIEDDEVTVKLNQFCTAEFRLPLLFVTSKIFHIELNDSLAVNKTILIGISMFLLNLIVVMYKIDIIKYNFVGPSIWYKNKNKFSQLDIFYPIIIASSTGAALLFPILKTQLDEVLLIPSAFKLLPYSINDLALFVESMHTLYTKLHEGYIFSTCPPIQMYASSESNGSLYFL